jgi:hypothetical protein
MAWLSKKVWMGVKAVRGGAQLGAEPWLDKLGVVQHEPPSAVGFGVRQCKREMAQLVVTAHQDPYLLGRACVEQQVV